MGTNFYWAAETSQGDSPLSTTLRDESAHIGKRSAAGLYCWDCDRTLCKDGNDGVHVHRAPWFEACPTCGKTLDKSEGMKEGAAAVELGFAKPRTDRPRGVSSTSSFTWAIQPHEARRICEMQGESLCVVNEYGDKVTGLEFLRMLRSNCAIEFTNMIGVSFS